MYKQALLIIKLNFHFQNMRQNNLFFWKVSTTAAQISKIPTGFRTGISKLDQMRHPRLTFYPWRLPRVTMITLPRVRLATSLHSRPIFSRNVTPLTTTFRHTQVTIQSMKVTPWPRLVPLRWVTTRGWGEATGQRHPRLETWRRHR